MATKVELIEANWDLIAELIQEGLLFGMDEESTMKSPMELEGWTKEKILDCLNFHDGLLLGEVPSVDEDTMLVLAWVTDKVPCSQHILMVAEDPRTNERGNVSEFNKWETFCGLKDEDIKRVADPVAGDSGGRMMVSEILEEASDKMHSTVCKKCLKRVKAVM